MCQNKYKIKLLFVVIKLVGNDYYILKNKSYLIEMTIVNVWFYCIILSITT